MFRNNLLYYVENKHEPYPNYWESLSFPYIISVIQCFSQFSDFIQFLIIFMTFEKITQNHSIKSFNYFSNNSNSVGEKVHFIMTY